MSDRPKWVIHLWQFIGDEIINERYGFPMDGSDDELLDRIEAAVNAVLCGEFGHDIIDDQCGIPEHRYCVFCRSPAAVEVDE